jgi:hypothetical protein
MIIMLSLYLCAAIITFVSYQLIPNAIDGLGGSEKTTAVVRSHLFTSFVRACGLDHMVMALGMVGMNLGWFQDHMMVWFIILVSAWIVAVISAVSAITIMRAAS